MTTLALDRLVQVITARPDVRVAIAVLFPAQVPYPDALAHAEAAQQLVAWCSANDKLPVITSTVLQLLINEAATPIGPLEESLSPVNEDASTAAGSSASSPRTEHRESEEERFGGEEVPGVVPTECAVDRSHKGKVGFFYKAWVCVACKCFFYRHVRDERNGVPVPKQSDPARYTACLKVGMDPSTVLIRSDCKWNRSQPMAMAGLAHMLSASNSTEDDMSLLPASKVSATASAMSFGSPVVSDAGAAAGLAALHSAMQRSWAFDPMSGYGMSGVGQSMPGYPAHLRGPAAAPSTFYTPHTSHHDVYSQVPSMQLSGAAMMPMASVHSIPSYGQAAGRAFVGGDVSRHMPTASYPAFPASGAEQYLYAAQPYSGISPSVGAPADNMLNLLASVSAAHVMDAYSDDSNALAAQSRKRKVSSSDPALPTAAVIRT